MKRFEDFASKATRNRKIEDTAVFKSGTKGSGRGFTEEFF